MTVHQIRKSLVSVIIPAHNTEKYIGEAIESALSQSYPELEIIVVDDGSTDNTVKIVNRFIENGAQIKLLRQKLAGVAAARNKGIRYSQGEFIAPLDADDIWYPDKISRQVQLMTENGPDVGLVYAWNTRINESSTLIGLGTTARYEGYVFAELFIGHFLGSCSSPLIRRACIQQVGDYNTQFYDHGAQGCEDWDLHLRISEHYRFAVVKQLLVGYRKTPNAMSQDHKQMRRSRDLLFTLLRVRHPEIPNRLFKWSNAFYHFYLCNISSKHSDSFNSFKYLLIASWSLPELVLCRDFRQKIIKLAKQVIIYWIPSILIATLRSWRPIKMVPKKYRLTDLQKQAEQNPKFLPGSIPYLRERLIEISRDPLSQMMKNSAPDRSCQKDTHNG